MAAARAGARHVYAIEASDIADIAAEVFEANGVADRVTLLRGWSTQVELPESATLFVSELIGSDPLEEDLLELTLDARRRLLAPGARFIPHRLELFARPLAVPLHDRRECRVDREDVEEWRRRYAMDFGPLWAVRRMAPDHWPSEGAMVAAWPPLGPPARLASLDLASFGSPRVQADADLVVEEPGTVNAISSRSVRSCTMGSGSSTSRRPTGSRAGRSQCGSCRSRSRPVRERASVPGISAAWPDGPTGSRATCQGPSPTGAASGR